MKPSSKSAQPGNTAASLPAKTETSQIVPPQVAKPTAELKPNTLEPLNPHAETILPPPGTDVRRNTPKFGTLGPYQLLEKLGEGGMGAVYKARHIKLGSFVPSANESRNARSDYFSGASLMLR